MTLLTSGLQFNYIPVPPPCEAFGLAVTLWTQCTSIPGLIPGTFCDYISCVSHSQRVKTCNVT